MSAMTSTVLAERLGWALLHSFWQIAVIAMLYLVARLVFQGPSVRYWLGMVAVLSSAVWPVVDCLDPSVVTVQQRPLPAQNISSSTADKSGVNETKHGVDAASSAMEPSIGVQGSTLNQITRVVPFIAVLWSVGLCLLLLRHAGALVLLHQMRAKGIKAPDDELSAMLLQLRKKMGVTRAAQLLLSARAQVPILIGTVRPAILIPISLVTGLERRQLEAILSHELAHLRRWDDVMNLIQCGIVTLLYFHPLIWWLNHKVNEDRELCCDDLAVRRGADRVALAEALASLAVNSGPGMALAASGSGPVARRIERLLMPKTGRGLPLWPLLLILLLLAALSTPAKDEVDASRGRLLHRSGQVLNAKLAPHVAKDISAQYHKVLKARIDVRLTLDEPLQAYLSKLLSQQAPQGASCVVLSPLSGEILASAAYPEGWRPAKTKVVHDGTTGLLLGAESMKDMPFGIRERRLVLAAEGRIFGKFPLLLDGWMPSKASLGLFAFTAGKLSSTHLERLILECSTLELAVGGCRVFNGLEFIPRLVTEPHLPVTAEASALPTSPPKTMIQKWANGGFSSSDVGGAFGCGPIPKETGTPWVSWFTGFTPVKTPTLVISVFCDTPPGQEDPGDKAAAILASEVCAHLQKNGYTQMKPPLLGPPLEVHESKRRILIKPPLNQRVPRKDFDLPPKGERVQEMIDRIQSGQPRSVWPGGRSLTPPK
jgi:beta-lactamase regulating signal transducer with metallopeptidase domain